MSEVTMKDYEDKSNNVSDYGLSPLTVFSEKTDHKYGYREMYGIVSTDEGYVVVWQYSDWHVEGDDYAKRSDIKKTSLDFIHKGREYTRTWEQWWAKKTIVRLAREFVKDIKEKEDE